MPTEDTRRMLKLFGIAVTDLEDALARGTPGGDLSRAEADVLARLDEVTSLVGRLRRRILQGPAPPARP